MLCSLNQGKQYKFLMIYTYITYIYIISHRHEGHWATAHRSTLLGKLHVFGSKGRERIRPGSRVGPRAEPELAMLGKHHMATRDCRGRWMRPGLWPNQSRCTWLSLRLQRTPALGWKPHPGAHPHRRPHGSGHHREGPGTCLDPELSWHCLPWSGRRQPDLPSLGPCRSALSDHFNSAPQHSRLRGTCPLSSLCWRRGLRSGSRQHSLWGKRVLFPCPSLIPRAQRPEPPAASGREE